MSDTKKYESRLLDIATRAAEVRSFAVAPQFQANNFIQDPNARAEAIVAAMDGVAMFESVEPAVVRGIGTAWGSALAEYVNQHGSMPRDDVLASSHKALENLLSLSAGSASNGNSGRSMMLESISKNTLATSEGVINRAVMAAMILPVQLSSATSDACTFIPCERDYAEIFELMNVAGSTFGDYRAGDVLNVNSMGQYTQMRQFHLFPTAQQPDGTKTKFTFSTTADCPAGILMPIRRERTVIMVNRKRVGVANEEGVLIGQYKHNETIITLTANVDHAGGTVTVDTSAALADGLELSLEFDCDIEKAPQLIPTITHRMRSWTLFPSESVIATEHTIQALMSLQREFGMDLGALGMNAARSMLADEKDKARLKKMLQATTRLTTFDVATPTAQSFTDYMYHLKAKINAMSQEMMGRTLTTGITGMFVGGDFSNLVKSLKGDMFTPAPNYRHQPRIHFIGTLFGMYKVFEVPNETCAALDPKFSLRPMEALLYGRGEGIGQAGFVAGDAVPAIPFNHPTTPHLVNRSTLWELGVNEIHPRNGEDYFARLRLTLAKDGEAIDMTTGLLTGSL